MLVGVMAGVRDGRAARTPQVEAEATYAPKLKKEDGRIIWTQAAAAVQNRIRGLNPWPGCFCEAPAGSGRALKIFKAQVEPAAGAPGVVLAGGPDGPLVGTGDQALRLIEVQPEGRKVMTGAEYVRGHGLKPGDRLG